MWQWLRLSSNQKLLALLGSGFAAIVVAAWTVYTHFHPSKNSTTGKLGMHVLADCGIAAGNNIRGDSITVNCGLEANKIESIIGATIAQFDIPKIVEGLNSSSIPTELEELAAALGIRSDVLLPMIREARTDSPSSKSISSTLARIIGAHSQVTINFAEYVEPGTHQGSDILTRLKKDESSTGTILCDLTGHYTYFNGSGVADVKQNGNEITMFLTYTPRGEGPHYEIRAQMHGNRLNGDWYSLYRGLGWYSYKATINSTCESLNFSESDDPISSSMSAVVLKKID